MSFTHKTTFTHNTTNFAKKIFTSFISSFNSFLNISKTKTLKSKTTKSNNETDNIYLIEAYYYYQILAHLHLSLIIHYHLIFIATYPNLSIISTQKPFNFLDFCCNIWNLEKVQNFIVREQISLRKVSGRRLSSSQEVSRRRLNSLQEGLKPQIHSY